MCSQNMNVSGHIIMNLLLGLAARRQENDQTDQVSGNNIKL